MTKEIALWAVWIPGFVLIVVVEVAWLRTGDCKWSSFGHVAVAHEMAAYAALWGGLGIAPQVTAVSGWMRKTFVFEMNSVRAIFETWDSVYGYEIDARIQRTVHRFSTMAGGASSYMLCYLVLLTLFPERCVAFEERIVVICLPFLPLGVLFFGYLQIRYWVKVLSRDAEIRSQRPMMLMLTQNPSQTETDSHTKGSG